MNNEWVLHPENTKYFETPKKDLEFVAFDVETTGLGKLDKIVEIAFVAFRNDEILEEWTTLINPCRDVSKSQIHGITASMVSVAPIFDDITNDIFRIINNRVLVAHNYNFDIRMLMQELKATNTSGNLGKGFCTLIASRNLLPQSRDSLSATCEALGIRTTEAHNALSDAKMAMQIFQHLQEHQQEILPTKVNYSSQINPVRTISRPAFNGKKIEATEQIRAFTRRIPFPSSDEKVVAYLLLLNLALQDLAISRSEQMELSSWAEDLDISQDQLSDIHKQYLDSMIQAALRDGVISIEERSMIESVSHALNVLIEIPDSPIRIKGEYLELTAGKRVCFTGEVIGANNEIILRSDLEILASKLGMHPVKDVTKKGCDILIAADEASMSGKAKKAKDWGIPVMSANKFLKICEAEV